VTKERGGEEPPDTTTASAHPGEAATLASVTAAWREATDALRDSDRRYRELVEYSLGLICTHDLTGTILSINPAAASSLGYQPADGIGRNLREFLASERRPLFDDYLQRIQNDGRAEGLMSVVSRNGETRIWMYRNVLSHDPDGRSYVLGHAIDVTERVIAERTLRHSEQELRVAHADLEARVQERTAELERARDALAFLANFSEQLAPLVAFEQLVDVVRRLAVPFPADAILVHVVDDDGSTRLLAADPAASGEELPRFDPASPIVAALALRLPAVIASRAVALVRGDELASPVARAVAMIPLVVDGRVRAVLSMLSGSESRFIGPGAVFLADVIRRIHLALDRIQLHREAQEANRLKDEFLGTLSHELRTPLNAICGWASILRRRNLDETSAHAVAVIQRNAEAQIRLIEEVLDVSRIVAGKMALAMEVLDVGGIVRAAIDIVRPALHAKRIRLEERLDPVLPVVGDAHRLQQVFWNLLSNALKFTGRQGVITVTLRGTPGHVEFEIVDTGIGIRRDVLPFVFDRFRQADSSMSRTHGGLGLGLAIVRHIVELHGGTARAASAGEGHGAAFTIQLPTADTDYEELTPGKPPPPGNRSEPTEARLLQGRTILVVEDHDDARELISAVLRHAGAQVIAVASTAGAMEQAVSTRPDVLVADLGLPGEDGYVLLTRFRTMHPDVPAIALTAYARSTDRERVLAHGFQLHVVKPVDPQQLVESIHSVL
jgi:PAS domain S-box-containing protein